MRGTGNGGRVPRGIRSLRWVLLALLLVSAALTLGALPALQRQVVGGRWPPATLWVPPALLAIFVVMFAAYRFALVRAGRYPAGKAFVQVGLVGLVAAVIAGIALGPAEREPPPGPVALERPLASTSAEVRALAAEVVRSRSRAEALRHVPRLIELVETDPAPAVRREARLSLAVLAGRDAGGEGPGASERWEAAFALPP
jgi:hypothetical protein